MQTDSTGTEKSKEIELLSTTFELYSKHISEMCKADNGKIFPIDIFFISNIQRSQFLIQGFLTLIKEKNFFAAAPLIRLHLDNLLHIYAVFIHPKPHELVTNLNRNKKRLQDYKDVDGEIMTDSKLVKKFFDNPENEEFYALKDVYSETSKFIHFSNKHLASIFGKAEDKKVTLLARTFHIPHEDELHAIKAMIMITRAQMKYLIGWTNTKNNPSNK